MACEFSQEPYNKHTTIPEAYNRKSLTEKSGSDLEMHYVTLLRELGKREGMIGQIFVKAQNKITDPAKLYKLIQMIDSENWVMLGADVKGDIYEGLLDRKSTRLNSS